MDNLFKNEWFVMFWAWSFRFWAAGECDFFHEFFMTFFSREKNSEKKFFRGSRGENSCIGVVWCVFSDVYRAVCVRNRIFQSYTRRRAEEPPLKQKVSRGAAMFFIKKVNLFVGFLLEKWVVRPSSIAWTLAFDLFSFEVWARLFRKCRMVVIFSRGNLRFYTYHVIPPNSWRPP